MVYGMCCLAGMFNVSAGGKVSGGTNNEVCVMNAQVSNEQIAKCLFNGNYKMGKLCGGLHKVANVVARGIALPEALPENTTMFLYMSNNIVLYVAGGVCYVNTNAEPHLSDIQKASVRYCLDNNKLPVENVAIEWAGKSGGGVQLCDKVAGMFA